MSLNVAMTTKLSNLDFTVLKNLHPGGYIFFFTEINKKSRQPNIAIAILDLSHLLIEICHLTMQYPSVNYLIKSHTPGIFST